MNVSAIGKKLPLSIRETLKAAYGAIPPGIRLGRTFWQTYRFLQESQWWDAQKLAEYQMRELERLLSQCYENVPHYRRVFDERGLKPAQIQSLSDLARLPYLGKAQIRKDARAFVARNRKVDRLGQKISTGTTGEPFQFYLDYDQEEREWAFACHLWDRVGHKPGDVRAEIVGGRIEGSPPYFRDRRRGVLRLSPVIRRKETVQLYLDTIRSDGIRFLYGYPSAITYFAALIKQYGLAPNLNLTAVLFSSETLYPWQRTIAEEVFACRSYSLYGLVEQMVMAGDCEASREYHCVPQYGITEIDPQTGEIIGTGFLNHAHPFVRYRTGDVATLPIRNGCAKCRRQYFPIVPDIEGRLQDFVVTPDGIPLNSCTLTFPFKPRKTIARVQIVQESVDRVVLRTAPVDETNLSPYLEELAVAREILQGILGKDVTVRDERIPPEECVGPGKLRFVVSHLPREVRCYDGSTKAVLEGTL